MGSARRSHDVDSVTRRLEVVRDCLNGKVREQFNDSGDYGFLLKPGEFAIAHLEGAALIETASGPDDESLSHADTGHALVTNIRILFVGSSTSSEWCFDEMVSRLHLPGGVTIFAMANGKMSGLGYGDGPAPEVEFRIDLAAALALGTLDRYEAELMAELRDA